MPAVHVLSSLRSALTEGESGPSGQPVSEKTWPAAQNDSSPTARNKIQPTLSGTIPPPSWRGKPDVSDIVRTDRSRWSSQGSRCVADTTTVRHSIPIQKTKLTRPQLPTSRGGCVPHDIHRSIPSYAQASVLVTKDVAPSGSCQHAGPCPSSRSRQDAPPLRLFERPSAVVY